ncbi:MAG: hypothetical protein ACO1RX_00930 [Candidatus Sericytochromatia bacterium]
MPSFHISSQSASPRLQFAETVMAPAATSQASAASPAAVADQLTLSGQSVPEAASEQLELFAEPPEVPLTQRYLERLGTRQSALSVGEGALKLEMGVESPAPEILTSAHEPSTVEALKARVQNPTPPSGEQVVRTGAVLQPHEQVHIQVGVASAVETSQIVADPGAAIKPGVYAGVAVKREGLSTRVGVDTALGQARVEVGGAVSAGQNATVGISYVQSQSDSQRTLRLGTEVRADQNTVIGVNLNQQLESRVPTAQHTAVGVYLNSRW